jgi:chromosome segregation ATPase
MSMDHTPIETNDIQLVAAGNLAFLLSVIRSGKILSEAVEAHVRAVIEKLESSTSENSCLKRELEEANNARQYAETLLMQDPCVIKEHRDIQDKLSAAQGTIATLKGLLREIAEKEPLAVQAISKLESPLMQPGGKETKP